jgi:hypothetical protein
MERSSLRPVHPVRRRHIRALRVTGGTDPSPLAREGDEKLALATLAAHPREAVRQHSALQVPGEVPPHVPGQTAPHLARLRQRRSEVASHRRIQHRPLRPPPPVLLPALPHLPLSSHILPGHKHRQAPTKLRQARSGSAKRRVRFPPLPSEPTSNEDARIALGTKSVLVGPNLDQIRRHIRRMEGLLRECAVIVAPAPGPASQGASAVPGALLRAAMRE